MARKAAHCLRCPSAVASCLLDFELGPPLYGLGNMTTPDSHIYVGRLEGERPAVYIVGTTSVEPLDPTGDAFDWGPGGAAAALELAHALLADASGSEPSAEVSRRFAEQILSRLPRDGFALQRETVNAWLRRVVAV